MDTFYCEILSGGVELKSLLKSISWLEKLKWRNAKDKIERKLSQTFNNEPKNNSIWRKK